MSKDASPRRSPSLGRYPRGEETRARIVAAGLKVFGEEGYGPASTRQIAREAGVTPPALQYYFDSKEGLHRACAEFMLETGASGIFAAMQGAEAALATGGREAAVEALCQLLERLVDASLAANDTGALAAFSARLQAEEGTPASALIDRRIVAPLQEICARLVGTALGEPLDDAVRLRSLLVLGQVSAFHRGGGRSLKGLGWPDFDGSRRDAVKSAIRSHTRAAMRPEPSG
jgi:AcrR family transcriptional regulator